MWCHPFLLEQNETFFLILPLKRFFMESVLAKSIGFLPFEFCFKHQLHYPKESKPFLSLSGIQHCLAIFTRQIRALNSKLFTLYRRMSTLNSKIFTLYRRMSTLNSKLITIYTRMSALNSKLLTPYRRMSTLNSKLLTNYRRMSTLNSKLLTNYKIEFGVERI